MSKMKIGMFTDTFLPQRNGVVTSICNIGKTLEREGHNMVVFTPGQGLRDSGFGRVSGFEVYQLRGFRFAPYPEFRVCIPTIGSWVEIVKRGMDLVHSKTPFQIGLVAKRFSKKFHVPIIGTLDTPIQDYVHYIPIFGRMPVTEPFLKRIARRYARWFYNFCHIVTVPSETTREELIKAGCRKRIEVLSNGVDMKRYNPRNRSQGLRERLCPRGECLILHVGRITREKGVLKLVKAAKALEGKAEFKLVMVGRGPYLKRLQDIVKAEGIKSVVFSGFVGEGDLPKYYASADLFVTASTVETQGIVLLEAMASGLPVIGADAGAVPELVKHGKNGYLFMPGETEDLAERMEELIIDESKRKAMGREGLRIVKAHSLESIGLRVKGLYKEVLSRDYWELQGMDRGDW